MNKDLLNKFGKRVKEERLRRGFSQEELGQRAKVHRTYVGMIERGEKNITLVNIDKVARALNLRLNELINF